MPVGVMVNVCKGFKEVILLGQNVNSYCDETSGDAANVMSKGFTRYTHGCYLYMTFVV